MVEWKILLLACQLCSPLRKHSTPAFSAPLFCPQLCWGRQSSKLLSVPLHPTSSRAKNGWLESSWVDCGISAITSAPAWCCSCMHAHQTCNKHHAMFIYLLLKVQVACIQLLSHFHPSHHHTLSPTAGSYRPPLFPLGSDYLHSVERHHLDRLKQEIYILVLAIEIDWLQWCTWHTLSWWWLDDAFMNYYPHKLYCWQQVHYDFKDCLWLSMDLNWISQLNTSNSVNNSAGYIELILVIQFSKYTLCFGSSVKLESNPSYTACIETWTLTMVMITVHQIAGFSISFTLQHSCTEFTHWYAL